MAAMASPRGVRGEGPGRQVGERAAGDVGEDLLHDRVVAVLALGLDEHERESVNTAWWRQTGNSSSCPAAASLFRSRTRRTSSRAVTAWSFFDEQSRKDRVTSG